ncbi:MAG: saccharopine dehydrogenase NADP-binding domain-containing protein [candidate division Zixibacteria bacterium]|nr:saccharopine dehydrogenase NADP-binding domain-containing protein [candidate division Zixibacteria bacterium]
MNIAVVGAGLMGRAAVYDLAVNPDVKKIGLFDIDLKLAREVGKKYGKGKSVAKKFDAGNTREAAKLFKQYDAVISAVTYKYNPGLAKAAIKAKAHFFDLGGNNSAVNQEFKLSGEAKKAGLVVIPDCGLAPGMVSVIAAGDIAKFDKPESLHIRVGGLPQKPRLPLNYQMVFSAEGLINEYYEPVVAIRKGKKITLPSMTDLESLSFKGIGKLEAFTTSGGTSTLPKTYGKILKNLDYKTIRYPGHCQLFKMMMDIGLCEWDAINVDGVKVSPRSVLKTVLDNNLSFGEPDLVLVRVTTEGKIKGKNKKYISEIIDKQDMKTGLTAMMRCTSFPITIIAWMACAGHIKKRGVVPQEKAVDPELFRMELAKRKIKLTSRWGR